MEKFSEILYNRMKELEDKYDYLVFYSLYCPYSRKALKYLVVEKKARVKAFDLDQINGGKDKVLESLIQLMKEKKIDFDSSHRTKPIVFSKGKFIGGYTEALES